MSVTRTKKTKASKEEKEEKEVCSICADTYTAVLRRKIVCKFCQKDACTKCIEHYLLSRPEDAHCIHCRVNYSDAVLKEICTKTYLQQTYFRHRQEVLVNRERANLPALQDEAQRVRRFRARHTEEATLKAEMDVLKDNHRKLIIQHSVLVAERNAKRMEQKSTKEEDDLIHHLFIEENKVMDDIKKQKEKIRDVSRLRRWGEEEKDGGDGGGGGEEKASEDTEKKKFIRRCMKAGCQGFLSTAWKCGICDHYSCSKCFTVRGPAYDTPHTCKKEDLETAELIRSDSKPCPNCGEFINKYTGCFGRDTPILMWEGTVKMSQEIREGDVLVGDDGMPRTVLGTICGVEELYEVKQTNGMSYVVTGEHTMVLLQKIQDTVIEMTVHQLITLPSATQSSLFGYNINRKKEESRLSIKPVGLGEFYGWKVDGNNRFLLKDGTILRNCDQVWCVTCRTPWDWATGKIVTKGAIHNPHYYEWLRRTGGEMPRNPADVPCGGYPNGYELRPIHYCASKRYARYFYEFHRICMELQDVTGQAYRSHLDERGLRDTHVRFLLGDFDEKTWGQRLAQAEKRRKRDAEIQDVFTAFRMVAVELLNRIQHYRDETVDTFTLLPLPQANAYLEAWHQEVLGLIHMVNDGLRGISLSHHCRVPYINIDDSLQRIHYYYTTRQWKEETVRKGKKKSDGEEVREEEELREEEVREEEEEVIEQEEKENGHRDEDEKKEDSDSEEDEEFQLALAIERSMTHS